MKELMVPILTYLYIISAIIRKLSPSDYVVENIFRRDGQRIHGAINTIHQTGKIFHVFLHTIGLQRFGDINRFL